MYDNRYSIDTEKLRDDLREEALGAGFAGSFGGAFIEASDTEDASEEELIRMAGRMGLDIRRYRK